MSLYLKNLKMEAFGGFANRGIGPFSPGLNVLYGKNEAGKTTTTAFVGGVLYGYPSASGRQVINTYEPPSGKQSGRLVFAPKDQSGQEVVLHRRGRQDFSEETAEVVGDLDRQTFDAVFSIDCSDFEALESSQNLFAKMLTAQVGTAKSPAAVKAAIDEQISRQKSVNQNIGVTLKKLNEERKAIEADIREAEAEEKAVKDALVRLAQISPELSAAKRAGEETTDKINRLQDAKRSLKSSAETTYRFEQILSEKMRAKDIAKANLTAFNKEHEEELNLSREVLEAEEQRAKEAQAKHAEEAQAQ